MKTCTCLLKAIYFAFDFDGEWRRQSEKGYNDFNDTQNNLMTWLRFSSIFNEPSRALKDHEVCYEDRMPNRNVHHILL